MRHATLLTLILAATLLATPLLATASTPTPPDPYAPLRDPAITPTPLLVIEARLAALDAPLPDARALVHDHGTNMEAAWLDLAASAHRLPPPEELATILSDLSRVHPEARAPLAALFAATAAAIRMHAEATRALTHEDYVNAVELLKVPAMELATREYESGILTRIDATRMLQAGWIVQHAIEVQLPTLRAMSTLTTDDLTIRDDFLYTFAIGSTGNDLFDRGHDYIFGIDATGDEIYRNKSGGGGIYASASTPPTPYYVNPVMITIDLSGNDTYLPDFGDQTTFRMGAGFAGIGILVEGGGDDEFHAAGISIGFGTLGGLGIAWDLAGNDWHTCGAACFGSSTSSLGINIAQGGNDYYGLDWLGLASSAFGGAAYFLDTQGDDTYVVNAPGYAFGDIEFFGSFIGAIPGLSYFEDRGGGNDTYPSTKTLAQNNASWTNPGWGVGMGHDE